jgi:FkbM family methyltransferase
MPPTRGPALMRIPRPIGTLVFLVALLRPWRPAFKARAKHSKLAFYVHYRDLIGRHVAKYGVHEPLITGWMAETLSQSPKRGIIVDVGTNLGWHAVHAAQFPAAEKVVAFEPDPFNVSLLERNLALNYFKNAVVSASAVGAGTARLYRYRSTNYCRHNLLADYGYGSTKVQLIDLDTALDQLGLCAAPVLVLKIDVEGYEPALIEDVARTLTRTGALVLEYSLDLGNAAAMIEPLVAAGFAPHRFADSHHVAPMTVDGQMDVIWLKRKQPA